MKTDVLEIKLEQKEFRFRRGARCCVQSSEEKGSEKAPQQNKQKLLGHSF